MTNEPAGPYGVYAWTEPEPLRQGETHLTIGVTVQAENVAQSGQGEAAITDAVVNVTYTALDGSGVILAGQARAQDTLGSVYYEADMEIPTQGPWQITIAVDGPEGSGETAFIADVSAPLPGPLDGAGCRRRAGCGGRRHCTEPTPGGSRRCVATAPRRQSQ